MARSPAQRLRLFDRRVLDLFAESGSRGSWCVSWNDESGVSTSEPGRESLRSWIMSVRLVEHPKTDVYLQTIMDDIDALAGQAVTHERIAILRERRARADVSRLETFRGPNGPMTPRQCFEDLAYTDHFHYDASRESAGVPCPRLFGRWSVHRLGLRRRVGGNRDLGASGGS